MATFIKILSPSDIKTFEFPPELNGEERKIFFSLPVWANEILENIRTPINKIGFVLQLGYFKAVNKFFNTKKFHKQDIEFILRKFQFHFEEINLEKYIKTTFERHQEIILKNLGFQKFNLIFKQNLKDEALFLCTKQIKPRLMFLTLVEFIRSKKIEIPRYYAISEIVTQALKDFEKNLISELKINLSAEDQKMLNELLKEDSEYINGKKRGVKVKRYRLTLLKKSNQSSKPSRIKENISDLKSLNALFQKLKPVIERLSLSSEVIQYYAQIVIKSKIFQMHRRDEKKYLFLLAFVVHQFYQLNDVLIEILMQAVQSTLNSSIQETKEKIYTERHSKCSMAEDVSQKLSNYINILEKIETTINNQDLSDEQKIHNVKKYFPNNQKLEYVSIQNELDQLTKESSRIIKNDDYYDILELKSVKLQNRVSDIVKQLEFDTETSNQELVEAIKYYKNKDGLLVTPPLDFLDTDEQSRVVKEQGKVRLSLYKTLLFRHVASGIKSGALNLKYSYKYKSFDHYLIPKKIWEPQQDELLNKTNLIAFKKFEGLEIELKNSVRTQFQITNTNILSGKNLYANFNGAGKKLKIQTPKIEKETIENVTDLFPKNRLISLFEVLSTINKLSQFTDCLEHWQVKHNREKPPEEVFFAGIIGYGCNLGIRKVAKISKNVNLHELENTVNWYFTNENLNRANDKILELTDRLQLPSIFQRDQSIMHTSSDGQKFSISVESMNAGYSYKYFGKGKGVSIYSFIDESHRLFYSTVINSSEREAAYVIDGLLHNDVVQSDIHSTDTHGYSEIIFAVTHLLGISFAPRIKNFRDQKLYSFDAISNFKNLGYGILPTGKNNTTIIEEQWNNILQLIVTIRLNESSASQLFRRLSSYSRQHPLYRALKEFGRIIKTLFLLKYIDDVELRQSIEKQLNKLESSNKFAKAIFYGNNQEFQQVTKDEQLITEGSKRVIENAIICWNYLYLSQMLINAQTENEKMNLLDVIKNGSVINWQHINLQGEYDFSETILKNSIKFKLPELLELKVN